MRRSFQSPLPISSLLVFTYKLLISLAAVCGKPNNLLVRAQAGYSSCFNDLYLSDKNADGRVDSEEYVEFCRLRLKERLQQNNEDHLHDVISEPITKFILLPSGLQSNFYTLACLCSSFQFDHSVSDKALCCVRDNAHISVLSDGNNLALDGQELLYANIVCSFTNRAIDDIINTMETIQPQQTNTINPTKTTVTSEPISLLTIAPTSGPTLINHTAKPTIQTTQRTEEPTAVSPSFRPTVRSSMMTMQPTIIPSRSIQPTIASRSDKSLSPTSTQTYASTMPSMQPNAPSHMASSSFPPTIYTTTDLPTTAIQPMFITTTTSFTILVQQEDRITVKDAFDIQSNCTEAMNLLATRVSSQIWFDDEIVLGKSLFYDRLFVELPTAIEIEDIGFTSTPISMDSDLIRAYENGSDDKNEEIFVGGPCPMEMIGDENTAYSCLEVRASILLKVIMDREFIETGTSADDVEGLYTKVLEMEILRGELAYIIAKELQNSTVIVASGQIIATDGSTKTKEPENAPTKNNESAVRVGVIVGLVAGALLLLIILVHFGLRYWKRSDSTDQKVETPSADTVGEEDLEAKNPGNLGEHQDKMSMVSVSANVGNVEGTVFSARSKVEQQQHHEPKNKQSDPDHLMTKTVPYFQTDTSQGSNMGADDTKSIGGISAESDAGWSEAYSSMGSASDDGNGAPSSPHSRDPNDSLMSFRVGPALASIDTGDVCEVLPVKNNQTPAKATPTTPTTPSTPNSPNSDSAPLSPITPKSIQLLEDTSSDDDAKILIHEDFSDDDDDNDNKFISRPPHKQSPEEYRSKVQSLIEQIVPEEIDQIDDMISQFKNREDELIETLLAMEKRTVAQTKPDAPSSPPSPSEKDVT